MRRVELTRTPQGCVRGTRAERCPAMQGGVRSICKLMIMLANMVDRVNPRRFPCRVMSADVHNGVQNVKSAALLRSWGKFTANRIEVPYPQRDLHVRTGGDPLSSGARRDAA